MLKLYYSPAGCSMSPHIILREAGYDYELSLVDLKEQTTEDGEDFSQVNPKGYVPALRLDDGLVLTEGGVIVQYLANERPEAGLMPESGIDRYHVKEWLSFVSSEMHRSYTPLFKRDLLPVYRDDALKHLGTRLSLVERHLTGTDYLVGNTFSVADAYCFTILNWHSYVDVDMTPWPGLTAYAERIAARPKVREAMAAEGLLDGS